MAQIIIHRGTRTIGGSCLEIQSGNTRLIFDLGMPLMENDGSEIDPAKTSDPTIENGILPDVPGLYRFQEPSVDAVIISHAHIDHYGLLNFIHPSIPIFMSPGTAALIDIGNVFYPIKTNVENRQLFAQWEPFGIGPFKITPHLMDHSGPDASAFLIEVEGKRLLYTGDFRGHGRKAQLLEKLANQVGPGLDCLIMEGTTLGGGHDVGFRTEDDVEKELNEVFSLQKDASFVIAAGSNIDRTVSLYKAAMRAGKILVLDLYNFHLLSELQKLWPSLPPHPKDNIRIFYLWHHGDCLVKKFGPSILNDYYKWKIEVEEIIHRRKDMVLRLPLSAMKKMANKMEEAGPLEDSCLIYSMWQGYLDRNPDFGLFCESHNLSLKKVHTSGHAYLDDLQKLVNKLKPKMVVPIHTLHGDSFGEYFPNVAQLEDGQPLELKGTEK